MEYQIKKKISYLVKNILRTNHILFLRDMIKAGEADDELDALIKILDSICQGITHHFFINPIKRKPNRKYQYQNSVSVHNWRRQE